MEEVSSSGQVHREGEIGSFCYRRIQESDHAVIKELHEEFFPVRYADQFYDDAVLGKGMGGEDLYTLVITKQGNAMEHAEHLSRGGGEGGGGQGITDGENNTDKEAQNSSGEIIIGFVFGQFMPTSNCDERTVFAASGTPDKIFYILTIGVRKEYRKFGE